VIFPALIGLLPMPGGAIFSAPMLGAFDRENRTTPEVKSFLNYWFRHVWEYWWPLYPGILLLCSLAGLSLWHYMLLSFPITLIAIAGGLPRLLRVPRSGADLSPEREPVDGAGSWRAIWPFGLAILPGLALALLSQVFGILPGNPGWVREAGFVMGLVAAVVWTWRVSRVRATEALEILLDPRLVRMWITVAGVFVFKGVIEQCGAAQDLGKALVHLAIPLEGVVVFLPLLVGGLIGLTVAYVGTTFPILIPLIDQARPELLTPLLILAFVSGFTGVLLSPLHLCLILSNEHFRASWSGVYRYLILPSITLFGGSIGYFWILKALS
jgi:integral membrane protein (TIGR00529 family)